LHQNRALTFCFDAFSSREPVSTSLENAIRLALKREGYLVSTSATLDHEEGLVFEPRFDASGLVTCVATDAATGEVLMVAHMNDEALRKTIATGEAWYFSRSRKALWRKGETSGQTQRVVEMRLDCDQDAVWIRVEQVGAACHTGRKSCFYRKVEADKDGPRLSFVDAERLFDPDKVYRK
jgi:phosphoribosyl-AMP cyclohydrolase